MNPFVRFMASTAGRVTRIIAGLALIAAGLFVITGTAGYVVATIGIVPLLAGTIDICIFGPLLGCPLKGSEARASQQ